jgi:hypothetical protein
VLRFFLLLVIGWPAVSVAQEMPVPMSLQAALFSKVLPFDRNLRRHAQGRIIIGLVYQSRFKMSVDARQEFIDAMASLPGEKIGDMPFEVVEIDINKVDLENSVLLDSVDVLYVAPLRAVGVEQITTVSRTRNILTLTGIPEYVQEGISVGIGTKAGKPQVLINLRSARLEHADFSSQLLKISRIVDSEEAP